jgi:hypothetical protein
MSAEALKFKEGPSDSQILVVDYKTDPKAAVLLLTEAAKVKCQRMLFFHCPMDVDDPVHELYAAMLKSNKWERHRVDLYVGIIVYGLWRGTGQNPCPPGHPGVEASSIVALSPDLKFVAMVNHAMVDRASKFPPPSKVAVDPKLTLPGWCADRKKDGTLESVVETIHREFEEETGATLDPASPLVRLGDFQSNLSRWPGGVPGLLNDRYTVFGGRTLGFDFKIQHVEWVPVEFLDKALSLRNARDLVRRLTKPPVPTPSPFDMDIKITFSPRAKDEGKVQDMADTLAVAADVGVAACAAAGAGAGELSNESTAVTAAKPQTYVVGWLALEWFGRMVDKFNRPRPVKQMTKQGACVLVTLL